MRIGMIFADRDVIALKKRSVQAVLIAPGCPINEYAVDRILSVPVFNLNDQIEKGAMASLSRDCAKFVRAALHDAELSQEAISSQNDIYQYHLRKQYLFYSAMKKFLESGAVEPASATFVFPFASLSAYESPMRPELHKLFNDFRTFGYLAQKMVTDLGGECEFSNSKYRLLTNIADALALPVREMMFQSYALLHLVKKIHNAKRSKLRAAARVGIVVRTDSEVISAAALIDRLEVADIRMVIIQDELLASATTVQRLKSLGLNYIPVGGEIGFGGLHNSFPRWTGKLKKHVAEVIARNLQSEEPFMGLSGVEWARWMSDRLFDFARLQRYFAAELAAIIRKYELELLVTFSYVDQWGPVIQQTGAAEGIPTICIQNAAQDPEEYPKLAWANHYCVESLYLKNRLIALGYPEDAITATGLPHYIEGMKSDEPLLPCPKRPAILVITQPIYFEYYVDLLEWLGPFCAHNGFELHVKYHPRQLGNEYANVLENLTQNCTIKVFHRENLELALGGAHICISVVSAAILKAINLGVPTISFLPKSEKYLDLYYCSDRNLFVAENIKQLEKLLISSIDDFPTFWRDFLFRRRNYLSNHLVIEPTNDSADNIFGVICDHLSRKI